MNEEILFQVTTTLAVITGTAGFTLAVLSWIRFRGAPFGRALAVLPVFMLTFTVYHAMLLALPAVGQAVYVEIAAFLLLVVFAVEMLRLHYRMSRGGSAA